MCLEYTSLLINIIYRSNYFVGFEVLEIMTIRSNVCRNIAKCRPVDFLLIACIVLFSWARGSVVG
jgi:hypothetical protein